MTFEQNHQRHMPPLSIDVEAITAHLAALTRSLTRAGTDTGTDSVSGAAFCPQCGPAVTNAAILAADAARLVTEVNRLYGELAATRLQVANLRAAIRAALSALADGETDPWAYLRDELDAIGGDVAGPGGEWCR